MEASVFGLMGLLLGFTFYGAASRFDNRRNIIVQEANAIGTAYLRLDLLPSETQSQLRDDFRIYVDSRLEAFRKIPDVAAVTAELNRSSDLQREIWKKAVEATRTTAPATQSLVLASLNDMIDITTVSSVALQTHPPEAIFIMLGFTLLIAAILAGYSLSSSHGRDWISVLTFSIVLGSAVYVILDYEYPRIGLIRIDRVDQVLVDTLEKMK